MTRLMTEEEARETECRAHPVAIIGKSRFEFGECIASKCQLWEIEDSLWIERKVYHGTDEYEHLRANSDGSHRTAVFEYAGHKWRYEHTHFDDLGEYDLIQREDPDKKVGYCGLRRGCR